jgi:hypothetical protein
MNFFAIPLPLLAGLAGVLAGAVTMDLLRFVRGRRAPKSAAGPRLERGLTQVGPNTVRVDRPLPISIGLPAVPPSPHALEIMRQAALASGADEVWWFWLAVGEGMPHLGLAVAPDSREVRHELGRRVQPVWMRERPEYPLIDLVPLDGALAETIRGAGELLYRRAPESAAPAPE